MEMGGWVVDDLGMNHKTRFADEGSADGDSDELNAQSFVGLMKKFNKRI